MHFSCEIQLRKQEVNHKHKLELTKGEGKKAKSAFTVQRKVQLQYYVKVQHKMIHPNFAYQNGKCDIELKI